MRKNKFVSKYLDRFMKDKEIKGHLDSAETNRERGLLEGRLEDSLSHSYDTYAKEYFDSKGLGSYVSSFLRWTGGAADVVGTYMFWALGGAGFGVKGVGLLEKSVADAIDSAHYVKHAETEEISGKVIDGVKIAGEGLVERAAAYLPLGVGEVADLLRGKSKFDGKVVSRAVEYARNDFLDYVKRVDDKEKEKPYVVPLDRFRNPAYADEHTIAV